MSHTMGPLCRGLLRWTHRSLTNSARGLSSGVFGGKELSLGPIETATDEENMIRETAKRVAEQVLEPKLKDMEANGMGKDVLKVLFENGLCGVEIDQKFGGSGASFTSQVSVVEEVAKVDMGVAAMLEVQNCLVGSYMRFLANESQAEKYLPRLATDTVGSFCLSEPESGSDAFALKTTAVKKGDDFVINGSKMWISNADVADIFLVMANANPEAGYKGITCFIVERGMAGLSVGPPIGKLGLQSSGTCPVFFDNVKVPSGNVLGEVGLAYKYAAQLLNEGRIGVAAQMVGVAEGCLERTVPYTLERKQFGKRIFDFQAVQHQIADIRTQIEAARLLVYNAARKKEAGFPIYKEASMAKYFAAETAQKTTVKCIEWMGGVGFTTDFPQEKYYRDCKAGLIYEGTGNIQLNTIAKFMLKDEYS